MSRIAQLPRTPLTNPYFVSLARQRRLCPVCGKPAELTGTLNPNAAYEFCADLDCPYCQTLVAPEWARVGGRAGARDSSRSGLYLVE